MEKKGITKFEEEVHSSLKHKHNNTVKVVMHQTELFLSKIIKIISMTIKKLDSTTIKDNLKISFVSELEKIYKQLFLQLHQQEMKFYLEKILSCEQILNSKTKNVYKIKYITALILKINEKEINDLDIFNKQIENNLNMNEVFSKFIDEVIQQGDIEESVAYDLKGLCNRSYNTFKHDVTATIENYLKNNQLNIINVINDELTERGLLDGKMSLILEKEKQITNYASNVIQNRLNINVETNKKIAIHELNNCSWSIIDLIFKSLPEEYKDQKELLEIILNTNINQRLGEILNSEADALKNNLNEKNLDIVKNEFYDDKSYKNILEYTSELSVITKAYKDVLHEIVIAYDIPEDDPNLKRLNLLIHGETHSTVEVFKKLFARINYQNENDIYKIKKEMHSLVDSYCAELEEKNDNKTI